MKDKHTTIGGHPIHVSDRKVIEIKRNTRGAFPHEITRCIHCNVRMARLLRGEELKKLENQK